MSAVTKKQLTTQYKKQWVEVIGARMAQFIGDRWDDYVSKIDQEQLQLLVLDALKGVKWSESPVSVSDNMQLMVLVRVLLRGKKVVGSEETEAVEVRVTPYLGVQCRDKQDTLHSTEPLRCGQRTLTTSVIV